MNLFKKLFCRKKSGKGSKPVPLPPWEQTVEKMRGVFPSYDSEILKAVYSLNGDRRFIVLKSEQGCITYLLEQLIQYDEDEYNYFLMTDSDASPADWQCVSRGKSLFDTEAEALRQMESEPQYRAYFVKDEDAVY